VRHLPYYFVAWARSGRQVFISDGNRRRTILRYRLGDARAHQLSVRVGRFYGMAALQHRQTDRTSEAARRAAATASRAPPGPWPARRSGTRREECLKPR
jgi:hypothetical protein